MNTTTKNRDTLTAELEALLASDTDAAATLQELVNEYNDDAVLDYADNLSLKLADAEDWAGWFVDDYIGEMTARDYAEQLVEEGVYGDVAPALEYYIDYEKIAHDLLMGDIWEGESGYLFRNS